MTFSCDKPLMDAIIAAGLDTVEGAFAYSAGQRLDKPGLGSRTRIRLTLTDSAGAAHRLYLKRYGPVGAIRRLGRLFARGRRAGRAMTEYENILAARRAGVPTMQAVGFGEQRDALGELRGYIIVTAVDGDAMSRRGCEFFDRHADQPQVAEAFTGKLLGLVCSLHRAGMAHRDLYAAHVFLHEHDGTFDLSLIDLARVFCPRLRPRRWLVKDLAALKYSMPPQWLRQCWDDFLRRWLERVGSMGKDIGRWHRAIDRRVAAMRRHDRKRKRS